MSQSAPVSRPSKSNRADPRDDSVRASTDRFRKPLTERDGVSLRNEVRKYGAEAGARPISWRAATASWEDYIRSKRDPGRLVLQNGEGDETTTDADPHRFAPEYGDKQYAKLKDLERGLRADYGKRLHSAMLTLTASARPEGEALPPVDHLDGLLSSWEAVRRALSRVLDGRRWEYLAILEPHAGGGANHGYLHVHIAVFVEGVVVEEQFRPVIEAHLRNCDLASEEAHKVAPEDPDDDGVVSVKHVGGDRSEETVANLGTYLAEYLGTYGDDPLDASMAERMSNAVLWATGRQRWRPSNGAQEYMKTEKRPDASEWELVAVEKPDGERVPASPGGGVDRFTTRSFGADRRDTGPPD